MAHRAPAKHPLSLFDCAAALARLTLTTTAAPLALLDLRNDYTATRVRGLVFGFTVTVLHGDLS